MAKEVLERTTGDEGGPENQNRLSRKESVRNKVEKGLSKGVSGFVTVERHFQEYGLLGSFFCSSVIFLSIKYALRRRAS